MSTNRENELTGLELEVYQDIWAVSEPLRLSRISSDLMLVSDEEIPRLYDAITSLVNKN